MYNPKRWAFPSTSFTRLSVGQEVTDDIMVNLERELDKMEVEA